MNKLRIKKGDNVIVLAGNDKGKTGKVLSVAPAENRAHLFRQITSHFKQYLQ